MNKDNGTSEGENATNPQVALDVAPPQLIKYLEGLDKRLQEERKREIHERFRNVRCFQHILGTSTSFKLIYDKHIFTEAKICIEPQNWGSAPIKLWKGSVPKTLAMSLHSKKEPPFLTYVSHVNEVTVFSPDMQEPIGRIVRREDNGGADIFCLATSKSFTMTNNIDTDTPTPSIRITDSQGRVVGVASVTNWRTIKKYTTTTYLKQFGLQLENGLSEPTRIMLLVTFANWAMWAKDTVESHNIMKKCIGFGFVVILLVVVLYHAFIYYSY